jgi:hypothetical protein
MVLPTPDNAVGFQGASTCPEGYVQMYRLCTALALPGACCLACTAVLCCAVLCCAALLPAELAGKRPLFPTGIDLSPDEAEVIRSK